VPRDHRLLPRSAGGTQGSLGGPGRAYDKGVDRAYLASSRALSALLILVGLAMVVSALARGGGALALGVVLGVLFAVLGLLRLRLARARER
jgi:hypothetical protein